MKEKEEFISITKKEYEELCDEAAFLDCLRAVGVDSWEWFDEAVSMFNNDIE